MTNTNTAQLTAALLAAKADARITVKPAAVPGGEYLAIDGRGLLWVYMSHGRCVELTATIDGDRIVFRGGLFGEHSLAADARITSAARVEAHWRGYCENTARKLGTVA